MIRTATIFRHTLDNGPGTIAEVLRERDVDLTFFDAFYEPVRKLDPLSPDLVIVLGGACGVYQAELYPFLHEEKRIMEARLKAGRPTLGICLGAQLMAAAAGAAVYPGRQGREFGWTPLHLTEAGRDHPVRHFDADITRVMQFHGDTFDLPPEATLLASTDRYPNQIFQVGKNCLGLQCHVEVTEKILHSWMVTAAHEVAAGSIDLDAFRRDNDHWTRIMQQQTEIFFHEWLDTVGAEL